MNQSEFDLLVDVAVILAIPIGLMLLYLTVDKLIEIARYLRLRL